MLGHTPVEYYSTIINKDKMHFQCAQLKSAIDF